MRHAPSHIARKNRSRSPRILLALALLCFLFAPGQGWSSPPELAEAQYRAAAADFHRLRSSPASSPGNWRRLAKRFGAIHEAVPGTRRGSDALFSAALAHRQAWRASGEWRDLSKAAAAFRSFVKRYPRNRLGDDSLMHLASMLSTGYHDPALALETYQSLLAGYPEGDQAPAAKQKLKEIASVLAERSKERKKKSKWRKAPPPPLQPPPQPSRPRPRLAKAKPNREKTIAVTSLPARKKRVQPATANSRLERVEYFTRRERTRVVLTMDEGVKYRLHRLAPDGKRGERIYFDLAGTTPGPALPAVTPVGDGLLHRIRVSRFNRTTARVVLDLKTIAGYEVSEKSLPGLRKIIIELRPTREALAKSGTAPDPAPVSGAVSGLVSVAARGKSPALKTRIASMRSDTKKTGLKKTDLTKTVARTTAAKTTAARTTAARTTAAKTTAARTTVAKPAAKIAGNAGNPRPKTPKPAAAPKENTASRATDRTPESKPRQTAALPDIRPDRSYFSSPSALRIRSIMLDPGHGGRDPGAMGFGLREKDLALEIAKQLRERFRRDYPEVRVGMTRTDDQFISLKDRPRLAKEFGADLFVSIHLNANTIERFHGVETYFLNPTQDASALKVAARENDSTEQGASDLNLILADLLRDTTIVESSQLAKTLQTSLVGSLRNHTRRVRDLGVKQAPFLVLMGAEMPGVLVEAGFLTNRGENRRLRDGGYMKRIANGFYKGLRTFIETQEAVAARQSLGPLAFNR